MKKILMGAVAALALAAPGLASADTIGSIGLAWGPLDQDNDGTKEDILSLTGDFSTDVGGHTFQMGAGNFDMWHDTHSHNYGALDAHWGMSGDNHAFGIYGGALNLSGDVAYGIGGEGAFYFGNVTLGGDVFYATGRESDYETTGASVNGAYYVMPNLALRGEIAYMDSEWMATETTTYSLGAEYQFASMPISLSGDFYTADSDYQFGPDYDSDVWQFGVAYHFGGSDVMSRDRAGANQGGLVDVARTMALIG
jgi:hypothetical protein